MFKGIGIAVGMYAVLAALRGEVHAKAGVGSRRYSRDESPTYFWLVIVTYAALSIALVVFF